MSTRRGDTRVALPAIVVAAAALALGLARGGAGADAKVPLCSAAHLAPVYVNSTAGAGSVDGEYGFRNLAARRCQLRGYAKVQMLTRSGGALPTTEEHAAGAYGIATRVVTLGRNSVAYFGIHFAAATGYGNLRCPTSATLGLTAPGHAQALLLHGRGGQIRPFGGSTAHLHCGIVRVSPLSAKRFQ